MINGTNNTVIATLSFPANPGHVAVNPSTNRVYFVYNITTGGYVRVINGASNTTIASVRLEGYGYAVAVNPTSNRIYAATGTSGAVEVIDGRTNRALGSVSVPPPPPPPPRTFLGEGVSWTVAVNPNTNRAYVSSSELSNGVHMGSYLSVIVECTLNSDGNFVCPP